MPETPGKLWRRAGEDRARYLELLREHGFIYDGDDGERIHTAAHPLSPAPRKAYAGISETEFQEQVFQLLHLNGWKVAHFRVARVGKNWMTPVAADGTGWPDLFCVHAATGDKIAVELKKEYGSPLRPQQAQWLAWLEVCGVECAVWRPSMIDAIIKRVRKPRPTSGDIGVAAPRTTGGD